ncbi:hypothetical protein CVT91_10785 [Candidatus Atribacteria bacterium HGW-Atribacteria-1]|nr:MAG: hypothetical protein CVT91_10785 [Candidatus Atribacteria bacterium HGW-Atribacteria-1]
MEAIKKSLKVFLKQIKNNKIKISILLYLLKCIHYPPDKSCENRSVWGALTFLSPLVFAEGLFIYKYFTNSNF